MLFIFILCDRVLPAIKPYSFQPNSLANSLSWEPMSWTSSQGSDILKRQALKQSKAKEEIYLGTGWLMSLKWEGPKEEQEKNLEMIHLQSIIHKWREKSTFLNNCLEIIHVQTATGLRSIEHTKQSTRLKGLFLDFCQVFTKSNKALPGDPVPLGKPSWKLTLANQWALTQARKQSLFLKSDETRWKAQE